MTKWILREVAREFLPADLVDRRNKMGMVSPLPIWLGRELRGWSQPLVESCEAKDRDPPRDARGQRVRPTPDALDSLELWFRTFHDQRG